MTLTWLILTVLGASILLWNHAFIRLWVGEEYFVGVFQNLLMVCVVYQFTFIRNDANIIDLTLRLRNKVILGLLSVTLSLLAAGIFIEYLNMGIIGLCLGIIAGRILLSIGYPFLIGRYLAIPWFLQLRSLIRPGSVTILLFAAASILSASPAIYHWSDRSGWIGLILSAGFTFCILSLVSFFGGLNENQRNNILRRFRAMINAAPAG